MKKFFNLFNLPIPYMIAMGTAAIILIALSLQGTISIFELLIILSICLIIASQIHFGSVVIKNIMGSIINLYLISLYTSIVIEINGFVIQPFFLMIASLSIFLAQTYNKERNYELRSRILWVTILSFLLVVIKSIIIFNDLGYWTAEIIGINVLIIFIFTWRLWINNSNKTKINKPNIIDEEIRENFKYIYITNKLDDSKKEWVENIRINAYPWIYSEVMKARDENLILVIYSNCNNSEIYDLGEIYINKAKTVPYLYLESTDDNNANDILKSFMKDIYEVDYYK